MLANRYPDLEFLLRFSTFEPLLSCFEKVKKIEHLDKIEIVYVYGLGTGAYYKELKEWLMQKKERALIFLEDAIAALDFFLKSPYAKEILENPQVHIYMVLHRKQWDPLIDELILSYPSKKIEIVSGKNRPYFFKSLSLKFYRKTASLSALFSEVLHYHKLFENLLPNFRRAEKSFYANKLVGKFKDIPAIICGAGPSLSASIPLLKKVEQRALIFGGGSTITALYRQGIIPHFCMALDPNPEEFDRLEPCLSFEAPFLYANRLLPSVFSLFKGPFGYLRTDTGGILETWFEEKLGMTEETIGTDLGNEAFSVTTMQIAFAYALGCNPIIITGVDLAFTGGSRYAPGVMKDSSISVQDLGRDIRAEERHLKRKDRHGKWVDTLVKWVMESDCISAYAKNHPQTLFINSTEEGLGFNDIPFMPLDEAVALYCQKKQNLKGMVQSEIQNCKMPNASSIDHLLIDLGLSLKRCDKLLGEMIEELENSQNLESGKYLLYQLDFQEEIAFDALLCQIGPVLDKMTARIKALDPVQKEIDKLAQIRSIVLGYIQQVCFSECGC